MAKIGFGRSRIYLLMFSLMIINNVDRSAISVVARDIAAEFHLSPIEVGYLFSAFLWTYAASLIPVGILLDRFGSGRINSFGVTLWSLAIAAAGASWNFASLLATRLFLGAGEATTIPSCARMVREWMPAKERGFASSIYTAGGFFGPAIGVVVMAWLTSNWGWRVGFFTLGVCGLAWLGCNLLWYGRPEDVTWLSEEERSRILAERGTGQMKSAAGGSPGALMQLLKSPSMWGAMVAQGAAAYNLYLLLFWLPSYLQTIKHLTIMKTGLYVAIPWALSVPLSIVLAIASDRFVGTDGLVTGRRRFMVAFCLVLASVLSLAPFVSDTGGILVLFATALAGVAASLAVVNSLVTDLVKNPGDFGKAISIVLTAGNVCGLLSPLITGYVVSATGQYDSAFVIGGTFLLVGAVTVVTLSRRPILTNPVRSSDLEQRVASAAE